MRPARLPKFPILETAAALGISIDGRHAHCFNAAGHSGGKDANPSLVFFPDSGRFMCFACGIKGDAINMAQSVLRLGFREALAWLTDHILHAASSRPLFIRPAEAKPGYPSTPAVPNEKAFLVYDALVECSYVILPDLPAGEYLAGRGLSLDLANEYMVCGLYEPQEAWDELTGKFGIDRLRAAGRVSSSDRFLFARHTLLFFYLREGSPVYVQGRDITGTASCKELSLSGLHSPVPYNADLLLTKPERVCLCEGCIDTLSALQLGYPAIGVPGVRGFRSEWFELFKNVSQIDILFDNDAAGQQAAGELKSQFLQRGMRADIRRPRNVNDMNDLLLSKLHGENL